MLPELDRPSLKEMGITLMGDMIAILRYAKKVVEETTCERFLVDSEDTSLPPKISAKPVLKRIVEENGNKSVLLAAAPCKTNSIKKVAKPLTATGKKAVTAKKAITVPDTVNQKQTPAKRKLRPYEDNENDWNIVGKKRIKASNDAGDDETVEYAVAPKVSSIPSSNTRVVKKPVEQKRTVFDRLGDSSVTSTTNLIDTTPTFNVTGIGKDVFTRPNSVFKRLGNINDKKDHIVSEGILKNGWNTTGSQGILKNGISPGVCTSIVTTKRIVPKTTGTMHADHEASKKTLDNVSRILKLRRESTDSTRSGIVRPAAAYISKLGTSIFIILYYIYTNRDIDRYLSYVH
jgi:hypothetical protein